MPSIYLLAIRFVFQYFCTFFLPSKMQFSILLFVCQDIVIICEYVLITFTVHSTCVYQVGGASVILRNCKFFLLTILTYFLLSAAQHFWIIYNMIAEPTTSWSHALIVLAFVQRLVSLVYYHACKETALTVSDPRYYEENIDWIAEQLSYK
ncbi:unnamed protein product [Ceratitis capitata]|uniref:Transmembrane protein 138 n=1 Tax=Ceratitis capitata TaxID=7213 RepID=A0A811UFN5_CERCA|nr:unnamed protein product [Ceratitis capitata]